MLSSLLMTNRHCKNYMPHLDLSMQAHKKERGKNASKQIKKK